MKMVSVCNPYGNEGLFVDKLVGTAYDTVKYVADNMVSVLAVATAITQSTVGEPLLAQRGVISIGATGALGATVIVEPDNLDMVMANILSSQPAITATDGTRYFPDSGVFTSVIQSDGLHLTLKADAPAECANATIHWFVIYGD